MFIPVANGIKPKMREVGGYIARLPDRYSIEVEGHTDDVPIRTPRYPDNWELSAARATAVVRYLSTIGVKGEKMKAIGLADTRPKRPNNPTNYRCRCVTGVLRYRCHSNQPSDYCYR